MVDSEISQLVEGQRSLESKYETVVSQKQAAKGPAKSMVDKRQEMQADLANISGELRNSTHMLARGLKQNPLTPDNLEKVQADRWVLKSNFRSCIS